MQMRTRGIVAALGFAAILAAGAALSGCGAGSGRTDNRSVGIPGVFLGSQTQTRAVGDKAVVELDVQTAGGGALAGTGRLTLNEQVFTGPITGSTSGSSATINVAYGGYGPVEYDVTANSKQMTGTYTHTVAGGGTEGGSTILVGQLGVKSVTLAGTYFGKTTDFGVPENPFSIAYVQTGNNVAVSGIYNGAQFTGTGVIIGTNLTFSFTLTDGTVLDFTGVISGGAVTGTYLINTPDPADNNHGIWISTQSH